MGPLVYRGLALPLQNKHFFPAPQSDVHNPLAVYLLFFSLSASILVTRLLIHPLSLPVSLGDYVCVSVGGVVI